MTKKEIISLLKKKEDEGWKVLGLIESEYGKDSLEAYVHRSKWSAFYELLDEITLKESEEEKC